MERRILFTGFILIFTLACAGTTPTPTATPLPTPSLTVTPSPTASPTPTPVILNIRIKDEVVNCRFGPGTEYELLDELQAGQSSRAVGRNDASNWWQIRDPGNPNGLCWVSANVSALEGDGQSLPIVQPPFVSVTKVDLVVEPQKMVVNCDQFPQTFFFEATISASGPTLVTWNWEASTGVSSDIGTIVFVESGTQAINEYYQVSGANDYWVKLHILTPNTVTEQVNFRVECSP
jgi:SH3-like domain-containing protein